MLRLSKKADYALMAMKHLALRGDRGSSSAREIAELYDIPIELMAKVLQRLVRRGLLVSQQGTRGGYQLSRAPVQITVADVIQAIDGPVTVTACSTDDGQCEQFSKCNVRDPLWRVRERILAALGECTIAELAADPADAGARATRGASHAHLGHENESIWPSNFRSTWTTTRRRRCDPRVVEAMLPYFTRALRQRRQPQPSVRLGGRGGGREGARAGRAI